MSDLWNDADLARGREADELSSLRERIGKLYEAIQHGDEEHRSWLREAITAHFAGEAVPGPRGQGSKDALRERVEALEGAVLPCDVTVSPATVFRAGVKVSTLLDCIEDRRAALSAALDIGGGRGS